MLLNHGLLLSEMEFVVVVDLNPICGRESSDTPTDKSKG